MSFMTDSPAHFLLLLHFRNIDRLWANWQARKGTKNAEAYGGILERGKIPTVDDVFLLYGVYRNAVVKEVMNIKGGGLDGLMCYEYVPPQTVNQIGRK